MMARRDVELDDALITVSPLEVPSAVDRYCALLRIALVDETTGRAPRRRVAARLTYPDAAGTTLRVLDEAQVCVAGRPSRTFSPHLATTGRMDVLIAALRFNARALSVQFACNTRTLTAPATTDVLTLNSSLSLTVTQRLLIASPDGSRVEFGEIGALGPGANQVTLLAVVNSPYPTNSVVQPLPADQRVDLHRMTTAVSGRILKKTGTVIAPLANAVVRVSKLWRQLPLAGTAPAPEPPVPGVPPPPPPWDVPIAVLSPPSYAAFPAGASLQIEDRPLDPTLPVKALLEDVPPGASEIRISDAVALANNDVLAIDADDDGRREIMEVASFTLAGTLNDWASVRLKQPLALSHRRARNVRRLQNVVPAVVRPLNYAALPGDEAVLFDASGIAGTHQVQIVSGPSHAYHRLTVLSTTSDAQGFYRLPPLTRAGKVEIFAKDSGSAANNAVELVPDYDLEENRLDITVS